LPTVFLCDFLFKLKLEKQTKEKLLTLFGSTSYDFLGFTLNLKKGTITDQLGSTNFSEGHVQILATLLSHYAQANPTQTEGKLVKFKDLPGGYSYEQAFIQRAIQPIADYFGKKPKKLIEAAKKLGGKDLDFADVSFEISALKGIPLRYILWGSEEFESSANILFDQTASNYLPTEDLAVLGELTTGRLIQTAIACSE
jgi:hypothetical protein